MMGLSCRVEGISIKEETSQGSACKLERVCLYNFIFKPLLNGCELVKLTKNPRKILKMQS
jgi:hypothetical protein